MIMLCDAMRICLVNPPRVQPKSWGPPSVYQPLDIAYVAATLEAMQHQVRVIDAPTEGWKQIKSINATEYRFGLTKQEIAERIKQWSPTLVIINVPSSGWLQTASEVASVTKEIDKSTITALFGLHPTARPDECLLNPNINFVIIGEPEQTACELASVLQIGDQSKLKNVLGLGFRQNGKTIINPRRPLLQNMDDLPFPARHLLPMDIYFAAVKENPLRDEVRKRWASIITSRGCVMNCVYCSVHIVMERKWRPRSPENVVNEIKQLIETYKIEQIDFEDGNMTLNKKRMEAICDLIIARGLKIEWFACNGVRADFLDENLLRKMRASGCRRIMIAPESGVQRVVTDVIHKNLDLKKVENAIIMARKVGIKVGCFFVMGLIGETKKEMEESIEYAYKLKRLGADRFYFSIAQPIYGTELYELALKGGFLKKQFGADTLTGGEPLIETPEFTVDDLCHLTARANLVNASSLGGKVVKAIKDPRKAAKFLITNLRK
jgi:anaerobic magnesium-protoporphyrin IX monomethyl ester cyclase